MPHPQRNDLHDALKTFFDNAPTARLTIAAADGEKLLEFLHHADDRDRFQGLPDQPVLRLELWKPTDAQRAAAQTMGLGHPKQDLLIRHHTGPQKGRHYTRLLYTEPVPDPITATTLALAIVARILAIPEDVPLQITLK
jgi:hypothetical protein